MKFRLNGWQTIKSAVKASRISRQRIHQLIDANVIPKQLVGRDIWVPDPLGYTPDRARQKRAKEAA